MYRAYTAVPSRRPRPPYSGSLRCVSRSNPKHQAPFIKRIDLRSGAYAKWPGRPCHLPATRITRAAIGCAEPVGCNVVWPPFANCAASPRIRVWFASHSSTGLCVDFGSKRIRFALRSSAFDIHYLPVDSSVSPFGCRAAPRCVNRHCRRPNNSQLLQFSMIAAMQSLDSGLATDRRIHSIPLNPARLALVRRIRQRVACMRMRGGA